MKHEDDDEHEGRKPYYPEHPGYEAGSETSEAAAHSVDTPKRAVMVEEARTLLRNREPFGLTSDELETITGWRQSTASALLRKLVLDGYAYDSAAKRPTRAGRAAVVRRLAKT